MANDSGVVYNGNPTEMLEGMAQLPDAMYVLGTPEMETFISLLKNGDTAYALVQIAAGGSHGKMELMGALQDRLILIEKKGTDHLIIPYSEINRVEVSYGWIANGISIYKKDGNRIDFNSVLKVASKHFDSWFSSYNPEDVSETSEGFWDKVDKKIQDERRVKVDQTVDDRDTTIQDSVVSRSNVGSGGSSKMQELKDLTEMKKEGLIDDDEFKQMKKEILGK